MMPAPACQRTSFARREVVAPAGLCERGQERASGYIPPPSSRLVAVPRDDPGEPPSLAVPACKADATPPSGGTRRLVERDACRGRTPARSVVFVTLGRVRELQRNFEPNTANRAALGLGLTTHPSSDHFKDTNTAFGAGLFTVGSRNGDVELDGHNKPEPARDACGPARLRQARPFLHEYLRVGAGPRVLLLLSKLVRSLHDFRKGLADKIFQRLAHGDREAPSIAQDAGRPSDGLP